MQQHRFGNQGSQGNASPSSGSEGNYGRDVGHEPAHQGVFAFQAGRHTVAADSHQRHMHGHHEDTDYAQWRDEQAHRLDQDYEAWRRERYSRFASEFDEWRRKRATVRQNQGGRPQQFGTQTDENETGPKNGAAQS